MIIRVYFIQHDQYTPHRKGKWMVCRNQILLSICKESVT